MKRSLVLFTTILLVSMLISVIFGSSACAPEKPQVSPQEFYKKEMVTLVSPYKAGGGADLDARLFAARWGEATDGGVMVNINKEAGGGIEGANYVYSAKPDGLTLGHGGAASSMYIPFLTNDGALKVDISKVNWFGALFWTQSLLAVGKHVPANNIEDLKQIKGLKFGAYSATSNFAQRAAIFEDVFKLGIKIVTGYTNVTEMNIAAGKKELDAMIIEVQTYYLENQKGFLKPPFLIMDLEKSAWYPEVKAITEIAKLTPEQINLLELLRASSGQGKAFFGPPGISSDKVKFLRDAWNKVSENKAFVAQMKELRYPVWEKPLTGEQAAENAAKVVKLKDSYGVLAEIVKKYMK